MRQPRTLHIEINTPMQRNLGLEANSPPELGPVSTRGLFKWASMVAPPPSRRFRLQARKPQLGQRERCHDPPPPPYLSSTGVSGIS